MVGPDLSLRGGIVTVAMGYLNSSLPKKCRKFSYLGTGVGNNFIGKTVAFLNSLAHYKKIINDYDIVHLHISAKGSYKRKSLMARIAHKRGKKVILHEHDGEFAKTFEAADEVYREDVRHTFGIADCVIVLSEEWRDYFAANVCEASKIEVLHNAVSLPSISCTPSLHKNVLFLGSLDARKSPDVLLRASRKTLETFPDVKLVFGGDGDVSHYRNMAEDFGIGDRCEFLGWVSGDDKEKLFKQAGIFCLPSKNEGMPMSVLEAMAHGIPTIATRVGGMPQVIDDGVNGFLIGVDNERKLSELLLNLESSADLRLNIGFNARKKIANDFCVEDSVKRLVTLYRKVIGEDRDTC